VLSRSADTLLLRIQEDMLLMSDRTASRGALFCGLSIERHVATSHLLRAIERSVDLYDQSL
jgi:hypothetical protein